ncbi:glycosyltransferase family 2 protein [Shewanella oncorhynchi]|uniref:glycosyltransferase family 2 protein n=1 Tax=Shewanella oncorhynchi TaxID=2726434 RepID=UPI003D7BEA61
MNLNKSKLCLVVIFYYPEEIHIKNVISLSASYDVIVVDNTPSPSKYNFDSKITLITLNDNVGIAKALNIGIQNAKEQSYQYCLLLDQDSDPKDELIDGLVSFYEYQNSNIDIALVAPCYHDKALRLDSVFIQKNKFLMGKTPAIGNSAIDASYVITSGSLLNLAVYNSIGPMNEDLFIDFVDIEWCLRAHSKGYKVLGLPWLKMEHEIGDKPVKFLGKEYVNHSPIRHYYYFRNIFMLLRMSHIPYQWKVSELFKVLPRFIVYATSTKNNFAHINHMSKGIYHGLIGNFGKFKL